MREEKKIFSKSELREFNGKNGKPIYVAYEKKVYNLTTSSKWRGGNHMGSHSAGEDLTKYLINAPHNANLLKNFPIVGTLEKDNKFGLEEIYYLLNPHRRTIHFSIAYSMLAPVFALGYLIIGIEGFESTSYYLLFFSFISIILGATTGYLSWKIKYQKNNSEIFFKKMKLSFTLLISSGICFLWRNYSRDIITNFNFFSYIYLILICTPLIISPLLGYYGGKLVT
jgi:predicted heme/steroid binding protein/uncharacterized membrane protein